MNQVLANRYVLETELARGAAGTVYRGRDQYSDETVAVKLLHAEAANEPVVAAAFLDEAEVLSELNHPGIVRPRDLIIEDGAMALVMDFVDGPDLRNRIRQLGQIPAQRAVAIVCDVAEALRAVHDKQIVHGDVKPGNILVPTDGSGAKLVDFGVSHRLVSLETPTYGTPDYTAPEVIDGGSATPKSDVYGLGLVLFEALCGLNPYRGGGVGEVLQRQQRSIPVCPVAMPSQLWNVVEACLALDPAARPDISEVASNLRDVAEMLPQQAIALANGEPRLCARVPVSSNGPAVYSASINMVSPVNPATTVMLPSDWQVPAAVIKHKSHNKTALLAALGAVALVAGAIVIIMLSNGVQETGVETQPKETQEPSQNPSNKESTEKDSPSSARPSDKSTSTDGEGTDPSRDSMPDGGTSDDSGDGSDNTESETDSPGDGPIGSPMPGNPGGG